VTHIVLYLLLGLLGWAAFEDAREYLIPNRISASVAALYPAYALSTGEAAAILPALAVGLGVLVLGLIAFARGILGGGDVKLMAAVALWAGPSLVLQFGFVMGIAGGLLSLVMIAPRLFVRVGAILDGPPVPYGIAVAIGGFYVASHLLGGI
jgi:prepilin peptidase CpaA